MANKTTNYNLTKPLPEEFYDIEVHNGNMDIIDAELKKRATLTNGKVPVSELPVGTAGGVAGIGSDGKVATENLPVGTAGGVAGLDDDGKLPVEVFPEGAVGGGSGKRTVRFTVGSSSYGWTEDDCDYLCDGTADEVEINAAIQALRSTGGEVVLLDGIYNLTSAILLNKEHVTLIGNGNGTRLIRAFTGASSTKGMVYVTADYCEVKNLYFDGVKGTYSGSNDHGIAVSSIYSYCRIEGCTFVNHGKHAVSTGGEYCVITNNIFEGNNYSIYLDEAAHNTVSANVFTNNNYCVYVDDSNGNAIVNNAMYTTTYQVIRMNSSDNNAIVGNASDGGKSGVYVGTSTNNTIVGNTFNNNTEYGIELYGTSTGNTIAGNTCIGNGQGDVYLANADNLMYADKDHGHDAGEITSGTLPATRGGTGVTSLAALATALGAGRVQSGSYTGTGTYGSGSPKSITCGFAPKIFFITNYPFLAASASYMGGNVAATFAMDAVTTSGYQFFNHDSYGVVRKSYVSKTSDGKTIKFYSTWSDSGTTENSSAGQFNTSGTKYYWIAIG